MHNPTWETKLRRACDTLAERVQSGHRHVVEEILGKEPVLAADSDLAVELIYAEYLARESAGDCPQAEEYFARFPAWSDRLRRVLQIDNLLAQSGTGPEAKDDSSPIVPGYRTVRCLGRGAMGAVYLAEQLSVRRLVALKILHPAISQQRAVVERFHREAIALGLMSHPHVAAIYASGVENSVHFLAMQYCRGESLQTLWERRRETLAADGDSRSDSWHDFVITTLIQVASALEYAHAHGVLHRDVKPSNIMVNEPTGDVWVVDFGLAKVLDSDDLTFTHGLLGTPGYCSPEQLAGESIDARSDIYSLGVSLQRMRTTDESTMATMDRTDNVERRLCAVIARATERDRRMRYPTMTAFREDLEDLHHGRAPRHSRWGRARRIWCWVKAQAVVLALTAMLVMALASALVLTARARERDVNYRQHIEHAVFSLHLPAFLLMIDKEPDNIFVSQFVYSPAIRGNADPFEQAHAALNLAEDIVPHRPEVNYYRAKVFLAQRESERALSETDRAIQKSPQLTSIWDPRRSQPQSVSGGELPWRESWRQAQQAADARQWRDVEHACRTLLEAGLVEPFVGCYLEARLKRCLAYLEMGQFAAAIEELGTVSDRWPDSFEPGLVAGKAFLKCGDSTRAEDVFRHTHALASQPDAAALWTAVVYHGAGDRDKVTKWITQIGDDYLRRYSLACLQLDARSYRLAEETLREAGEVFPQEPAIWTKLSQSLCEQGQFDQAVDFARRALELDPTFAEGHAQLGVALAKMGARSDAMQAYSRAVQCRPRDPYFLRDMGNRAFIVNQFAESASMLREAIRLDPRHASAHFLLAAVHDRTGNQQGAMHEFREAVRLLPRHGHFHMRLADCYRDAELWCDSLHEYLSAIDSDPPDHFAIRSVLGGLQRKKLPSCDDDRFHAKCGAGIRLIDVIERANKKSEDPKFSAILAYAYLRAPEHPDHVRALEAACRAIESPLGELTEFTAPLVEVITSIKGDSPYHSLEFLPTLPAYAAIDAILAADPSVDISMSDRLQVRFQSSSRSTQSSRRTDYLTGCLAQSAGRYSQAAEIFQRLATDEDGRPEPLLRLAQCLQCIGDCTRHASLQAAALPKPEACTRPLAAAHWEFNGDFRSTGMAPDLIVRTSPSLPESQTKFEQATFSDGTAKTCRFSRGTCFEFRHQLCAANERLDAWSLIVDVCFDLEPDAYTAVLQTDPQNLDDADLACHPHDGFGIGGHYGGTVEPGHWYRLVTTVDTRADCLTSYIDGKRVQWMELPRGIREYTLGPSALLFGDESQEVSAGAINSLQLRNYAMSAHEIALLGGPTASGIPVAPGL